MSLPAAVRDSAVRHVETFCENRVPAEARSDVRLEHTVRGSTITIIERHAPWSELVGPDWTSVKIAQLRYDAKAGKWSLYAVDRNERWFPYDSAEPTGDVGPLLAEIADDATGIFWG